MAETRPERLAIAVPVGDPNGIGPEIALMSVASPDVLALVRPILIADREVIEVTARRLGLGDRLLELVGSGSVAVSPVKALERGPSPGEVTADAGAATVAYARAAIRMAEVGEAQAVVAGPHNETAIANAGIPFSGYPQLLAESTGVDPDDVFLMLVSPRLRIIHATLHLGLRQALDSLTQKRVLSAVRAANSALGQMGIGHPRIAVCGINPHAGESGLFGDEDDAITAPAVAQARAEGIDVHGPEGADLLLAAGDYDAYVAMYHDQGHIPIKLEGRGNALGLSVGAPVLFSTVAHGSAHDIAGTGTADSTALAGALVKMATILKKQEDANGRDRVYADGV